MTMTHDTQLKSMVEHFYHWEQVQPDKIFLRQPSGNTWHSLSYAQAGQEARQMAAALKAKGLGSGDHIGILSKNCYHWILTDLAIMMIGAVSVPFYASLPKQQLVEVIELSDIKALFIGKLESWGNKGDAIPNDVMTIKFPQYQGNAEIAIGEDWNDLIAKHEAITESLAPKIDSLWTIKFTSGTTGTPKGVMLSHRSPAMMMEVEKETNWVGLYQLDEIRCLSFLPLNHVGERIGLELVVLTLGGTISFAESLETFGQNLRDTQPTLFFAVPRIWMKFYQGVIAKIPPQKLNMMLQDPTSSDLVKKKIRAELGFSALGVAATGAAITPAFLKDFYKKLGIHLTEAYGMTEVCGAITHSPDPNSAQDSVGQARPYTEVRIDPDSSEILMKSPYVMMGYYKNPEKTAEVLKDGWMHSGDKGTMDENGYVRIIGRVNDAFKTSKGSYVTPNPLEEHLIENEFIEQTCVVGLGIPQPIAIVNLSEQGKQANQEEVEKSILECVKALNNTRASFEKISTVVIQKESWSEANGCLTPTLKVKRGVLDEKFGPQYAQWHDLADTIIWQQAQT